MSLAPAAAGVPHLAAWLATDPRMSAPLDEAALALIGGNLVELGARSLRAGCPDEFRASLVKMLAAVVAAPLADMTESEAFEVSLKLREAIYFEMMQFRRAGQRDMFAGAFDA